MGLLTVNGVDIETLLAERRLQSLDAQLAAMVAAEDAYRPADWAERAEADLQERERFDPRYGG